MGVRVRVRVGGRYSLVVPSLACNFSSQIFKTCRVGMRNKSSEFTFTFFSGATECMDFVVGLVVEWIWAAGSTMIFSGRKT